MILPHKLICVELRTWDSRGDAQAKVEEVIHRMAAEITWAQASGVSAIVECSTVGVGRRVDIDRAVSGATHLPLVVPTGVYREPWIPDWELAADDADLANWMLSEVEGEMEESGV